MAKNSQDNFLVYIPKKKHTLWEKRRGRVYLIFNHNKPVEKFLRWLVKKPSVSDLELDALGTEVWININGINTVYDIGERLKDKFGKSCEPVYERLIMYLRYLNRKGWISFDRGNQNINRGDGNGA